MLLRLYITVLCPLLQILLCLHITNALLYLLLLYTTILLKIFKCVIIMYVMVFNVVYYDFTTILLILLL